MTDERVRAWAYLSAVVAGPPHPAVTALIDEVGVVDAARAVRERADLPDVLRQVTSARRHLDTAEQDLERVESLGGRLVTPDDKQWPAWRLLAFSVAAKAEDAPADCAAPLALWVRGGADLIDVTDRAVALVGTRVPSSYGNEVATEMAADLAREGTTVVSGAAFGIDAAAHRGALGGGGRTVAVLACGVDVAYPAAHERLLREIAREGLVVSEYPPGHVPRRYQFLHRNRLIAGLSDAVVVVEAGRRSGARNTVRWARALARVTSAVPGPVTSATSVGCHQMIRTGEARLVRCTAEVLEETQTLLLPFDATQDARRTDKLGGDRQLVYEALPAADGRTPRQLSEESGVPIGRVRAVLPSLEIDGFVETDGVAWYRVRAV